MVATARLGAVAFAGQPLTWAGSTVIAERPMADDVAEIRLFNSVTGAHGGAVLRGSMGGCWS